jgi:hypothetical protein
MSRSGSVSSHRFVDAQDPQRSWLWIAGGFLFVSGEPLSLFEFVLQN